VTGHLFQCRFSSTVMDDAHLLSAVRYLAFNPVRAGMVKRAEEWPWSSVTAHLRRRDDALVSVTPLLERVAKPRELFEMSLDEAAALFDLETKSMTGRPLGSAAFVADVEQRLGYSVAPQ
jgi:putative transposase